MLHFLKTNCFLPKTIFKGRIYMQQIFFWDSLNSSSSADSNSNLGLWEYFWEFSPDFRPTNSVNSESVFPIQICPDLSTENPATTQPIQIQISTECCPGPSTKNLITNLPIQIQNSPEFSLGETPNSNSNISPPIQNSNLPINPLIQISNPIPTIKELQSTRRGQLQPIEISYSRKKHSKNMEIPDASHSQESNPESGMETKQSDQNIPKWEKESGPVHSIPYPTLLLMNICLTLFKL